MIVNVVCLSRQMVRTIFHVLYFCCCSWWHFHITQNWYIHCFTLLLWDRLMRRVTPELVKYKCLCFQCQRVNMIPPRYFNRMHVIKSSHINRCRVISAGSVWNYWNRFMSAMWPLQNKTHFFTYQQSLNVWWYHFEPHRRRLSHT